MRTSILLAVTNVALAALVIGCGESVPQKSARGGVLSGTEIERQRFAAKRNPILAGNGIESVGQSAAAPSTVAPATPRDVRPPSAGPATLPAATPSATTPPPTGPAPTANPPTPNPAPTGTPNDTSTGRSRGAKGARQP